MWCRNPVVVTAAVGRCFLGVSVGRVRTIYSPDLPAAS